MKTKCTCACHTPGNMMMHIQACCNNGWIETPDLKQYVKDGDWFRKYNEDLGSVTYRHLELSDGKIEINPEWEILEETLGRVYVVKPEKIKEKDEN